MQIRYDCVWLTVQHLAHMSHQIPMLLFISAAPFVETPLFFFEWALLHVLPHVMACATGSHEGQRCICSLLR